MPLPQNNNNNKDTYKSRKNPANKVGDVLGRIAPRDKELEEAVLGALMLEKDAFSVVSELLKPECFYERGHQLIFMAVRDLYVKQDPVDMITVTEQLKRMG